MSDKLVSVLCPCYNSKEYIHRLLDSVLGQRYANVEMVVIDDGSTDSTDELVLSYIPKFEEKGFSLSLVRQENQGQSVAINNGLKLIHGEYLVWPDSDDFYTTEEAFSKMVNTLESSSDEFRMVRCQEVLVDESTLSSLRTVGQGRPFEEPASLFDDCVFHLNDFYFYPGGYMLDMNVFREETNLEIFTTKNGGQNWQMMLPMLIRHRCLTIPEPLYSVVTRNNSHSRGQFIGFEQEMRRNDSYENVLVETLKRLKDFPVGKLEEYIRKVNDKYALCRLEIALKYVNRDAIRNSLACVEKRRLPLASSTKFICKLVCLPVFYEMYLIYKRVKRKETF